MYTDDGINATSSEHICRSDTAVIISDLWQAGCVLNVTKSRLQPEQVGRWLGFSLDLKEGFFFSLLNSRGGWTRIR